MKFWGQIKSLAFLLKFISKSDENVYPSQGCPHFKDMGSPKIKQYINVYFKKLSILKIQTEQKSCKYWIKQ